MKLYLMMFVLLSFVVFGLDASDGKVRKLTMAHPATLTVRFPANLKGDPIVSNQNLFEIAKLGDNIIVIRPTRPGAFGTLSIATEDGSTYVYLLQEVTGLSEKPLVYYDAASEVTPVNTTSNGDGTTSNTPVDESQVEKQSIEDYTKDVDALYKKYRNMFVGTPTPYSLKSSGMLLRLQGVFIREKKMYVVVKFFNTSKMMYQISNVSFSVAQYAGGFLSTRIPINDYQDQLVGIQSMFPPNIKHNEEKFIVFVFKEFGISSDAYMRVKISEENGMRDLDMEFPYTKAIR